ncbi:hypothetical protein RLEG12_07885 (plasmid) [Rhizobium leguminosarum bv. trifolii CB782]|nr:hypothetical protein RLEG12_07885 [Rhizobium leguminosarum bv. trifolii CB782]
MAYPLTLIPHIALLMCNWPQRSQSLVVWAKQGQQPLECSSFSRVFASVASLRV